MSIALKMPPLMRVAEFLEWEPDPRWQGRWQLRDGELEMLAPASDAHGPIQARLVHLIEILSPSNVSRTCLNVLAYRTIPTVAEILVLRSTADAAEILRRAPDGAWPLQPEILAADGELQLASIGFAAPLRDAYRTTNLA